MISTVHSQQGNLDMSDIAGLLALDLQIDNENPLPKNLPNVDTMNNPAESVGRWVYPIVCPWVEEANDQNLKQQFSRLAFTLSNARLPLSYSLLPLFQG